VVFATGEGLRALLTGTPEEAERLAVDFQRHGQGAWVVELEGDGELVEDALQATSDGYRTLSRTSA
jgi:esterase/lipase